MARGRIIDKEIFTNEELADLSFGARWLYAGLIVHADDAGRIRASERYLKIVVFPYDKIEESQVSEWREELIKIKIVQPYTVGGKWYLLHPNWSRWQPIRKDRKKATDCPEPPKEPVYNTVDNLKNTAKKTDKKPFETSIVADGLPLPYHGKPEETDGKPQLADGWPNLTVPNLTVPNLTVPTPTVPTGDEQVEEKGVVDNSNPESPPLNEKFEKFWGMYPRKVGKGAAEKIWKKIKPNLELAEKICYAVDQQKKSTQWTKDGGQFIPHPATWLHQQRWKDELDNAGGKLDGRRTGGSGYDGQYADITDDN